jgi:hypothetical protein
MSYCQTPGTFIAHIVKHRVHLLQGTFIARSPKCFALRKAQER